MNTANDKKKRIIILDTNFIIEHRHNFKSVLKALSEHGEIFLSEITIEERLAQTRMEIKQSYDEITRAIDSNKGIAKVNFSMTLDEKIKAQEQALLTAYKEVIGENIIKFPKDEKTFSCVLERAYNKLPPFSKGDSDKGFKDALLWVSLLSFFANSNDMREIVLITDDKGFVKNKDVLQDEFHKVTNMKITIHENSYYNELVSDKKITTIQQKKNIAAELSALEIENLRKEIQTALNGIGFTISEDPFGREYEIMAFKLDVYQYESDIKKFYESLSTKIQKNLFVQKVMASEFFDSTTQCHSVDIENYERLNLLYTKIRDNYPDFLQQFFSASLSLLSKHYSDDCLPF